MIPYRLAQLPFDNTYARLPRSLYQRIDPTPLEPNPHLIAANPAAAALLELDPAELNSPEFIAYCNGERHWPGSEPLAMLYAGHQFGFYVPQLGDGRAILLGEVRPPSGAKWDIQVKGSGQTAYSRNGDGRAVLRSTIREYLASEAMHGLGVPTTRALAIIGSDEPVAREQLERGALLVRLSPSHVRFGTFEVLRSRRQYTLLRSLADYVITEHYPSLHKEAEPYLALFQTIVQRTARLIAQWQVVGFVHGVMNTDNMSVLGLTLDYGPFAFFDTYQPCGIFNHSDHEGRYTYAQQPAIALWNLQCLGHAFAPLLADELKQGAALAQAALVDYQPNYQAEFYAGFRNRLGLLTTEAADVTLISDLLDLLSSESIDFHLFFRRLCAFNRNELAANTALLALLPDPMALTDWLSRYQARLALEHSDDAARQIRMQRCNPKYVLRTHLAQRAIAAAEQGDYGLIQQLLTVLHDPYADHPTHAELSNPPPAGGQSVLLSCSS